MIQGLLRCSRAVRNLPCQSQESIMLTAYYVHRLPADYDLDIIRNRVRERGRLWDDTPDLVFKGFCCARRAATVRRKTAMRRFICGAMNRRSRVRHGRPLSGRDGQFRTRADRRAGRARCAQGQCVDGRFVRLEAIDIPADADLDATLAQEVERNRDVAARQGGCGRRQPRSAALAADARARIGAGAGRRRRGHGVPVLHLARPLLDTLEGEWGVMAGAVFRSRAGPAGEPAARHPRDCRPAW